MKQKKQKKLEKKKIEQNKVTKKKKTTKEKMEKNLLRIIKITIKYAGLNYILFQFQLPSLYTILTIEPQSHRASYRAAIASQLDMTVGVIVVELLLCIKKKKKKKNEKKSNF